MSFVSVDFDGARSMADEIETMGKTCTELSTRPGAEELTRVAEDLETIARDIRKACDAREKLDGDLLKGLRPDYKEVLK